MFFSLMRGSECTALTYEVSPQTARLQTLSVACWAESAVFMTSQRAEFIYMDSRWIKELIFCAVGTLLLHFLVISNTHDTSRMLKPINEKISCTSCDKYAGVRAQKKCKAVPIWTSAINTNSILQCRWIIHSLSPPLADETRAVWSASHRTALNERTTEVTVLFVTAENQKKR